MHSGVPQSVLDTARAPPDGIGRIGIGLNISLTHPNGIDTPGGVVDGPAPPIISSPTGLMPSRKKPGTGLIPACSRSASSASWLFMCVFRLYSCAKRLSHPGYVHAYGRSPVCVRVCERKLKSSEKRLPQPGKGH